MAESNSQLLEMRKKHIPQGPGNITQAFIREARGAVMVDVEGRELIDFAGGIGVNNVGHCHPKVVAAIKDQAEKCIHTCFHVAMYEPYVKLAQILNEQAPGNFDKMTIFANSGAEAVENAVKVARYATKRPGIICFENAFHGRTQLGMSLTSKVMPYKKGFGPLSTDIYRVPFPYLYRSPYYPDASKCVSSCIDYFDEFFSSYVDPESIAAIIAEPIQGEGGFITPPQEYFPRLKAVCEKYGILLIIDEIQSGAGRTGKMFAIEHWGIEPDIITMAKSFAGGMPLSAVIGRAELMNAPHIGGLGGTYGGNPVSCRAALAVMEILLEDGLMERAVTLGETLHQRFSQLQDTYDIIGDVRGKGPMLALELVGDRETKAPATDMAKALVAKCFEKGLVVLSCGHYGNVIRTLMPLVITDEQLERGLSILSDALKEVSTRS